MYKCDNLSSDLQVTHQESKLKVLAIKQLRTRRVWTRPAKGVRESGDVSSGGGSAVSDVRGVLQRHKLSDLLGMSHVQDPEHHASETDPWVWKLYAYLEDLQLWKHYALPRPPSPGKRWKRTARVAQRSARDACFHERLGDIFTKHNHDFSWMLATAQLSFVGVYVKRFTITVVHNPRGRRCRALLKGHSTSPTSVRINDHSTGLCGVLPDDAQYQRDDVF